jgi:hypothetical protein
MKSVVASFRDKLAQAIEEKNEIQEDFENLQDKHESLKDVWI